MVWLLNVWASVAQLDTRQLSLFFRWSSTVFPIHRCSIFCSPSYFFYECKYWWFSLMFIRNKVEVWHSPRTKKINCPQLKRKKNRKKICVWYDSKNMVLCGSFVRHVALRTDVSLLLRQLAIHFIQFVHLENFPYVYVAFSLYVSHYSTTGVLSQQIICLPLQLLLCLKREFHQWNIWYVFSIFCPAYFV